MAKTSSSESTNKRSIVEIICDIQPYYALAMGLIPGFGLIFGSLLLQNASLTAHAPTYADVDREVGYMPALNWSLTYAILFPLALFLMTNTISGLASALDGLHTCGMVRDKTSMSPICETTLTSKWMAGTPTRSFLLFSLSIVLPAIYGFKEWYSNNLLRLIHKSPVPSKSDYDWGLIGIMMQPGAQEWSRHDRIINAIFDFFAFGTEMLLIGSLIAFFIIVLDLGRVVPSGRRRDTYTLMPHLESTDRRFGFEVFAYPLEQLLGVALVAYIICYFVRLEGAYLASKQSANLADFVIGDMLSGVRQAAKTLTRASLVDAFVSLFQLGEQQVRGALACLLSILIAVFSLITVLMTVRGAALLAKAKALQQVQVGALQIPGIDRTAALKKVNSMLVWPFGYLKIDVLLFWVFGAIATLVLYRIGLFVTGVILFSLFFRLMKKLLLPGKITTATPRPDDEEEP